MRSNDIQNTAERVCEVCVQGKGRFPVAARRFWQVTMLQSLLLSPGSHTLAFGRPFFPITATSSSSINCEASFCFTAEKLKREAACAW